MLKASGQSVDVDFRPAVRAFAPGPRRGRDGERIADDGARHDAAEQEHVAVGVAPVARVPFVFGGVSHARARVRASGGAVEHVDVCVPHAHDVIRACWPSKSLR